MLWCDNEAPQAALELAVLPASDVEAQMHSQGSRCNDGRTGLQMNNTSMRHMQVSGAPLCWSLANH